MGKAMCGLQLPFQVIIIISLFRKLESATRPVVTFSPDWNKIVQGQSITMTCNVKPKAFFYQWYHNNRKIYTGKDYVIESVDLKHSGEYQCLTILGNTSEKVTLNVSVDPVILQAPLYIYEGDNISLQCYSPPELLGTQTIFYRNDQMLHELVTKNDLLPIEYKDLTATYRCSKQIPTTLSAKSETTISYTDNSETIPVTIAPDWNTFLTGESITMTCHGNKYVTYNWYHNGNFVVEGLVYTISSAEVGHSGVYQCWNGYKGSVRFRLDVREGPLILRAPVFVIWGRNINLNCHSRPEYSVHRTKFYKGNNVISGSSRDPSSAVLNGNVDVSGCESILSQGENETYTDEMSLHVRDLFSKPNIILYEFTKIMQPMTEGDNMTLICDTSPLRQGTQLQFAFYRDGEEVQKFSSSRQYEVYSAQLKDSGNYSCEVRNPTNSVIKQSEKLYMQIEGKNTEPENSTFSLDMILIILAILLVIVAITVIVIVIKYRCKPAASSRKPTMDPPEQEFPKGFNQEEDACYAEINDIRKESSNGLNLEGDVCYAKIRHSLKAPSYKAPEREVVYSEIKTKMET